ncbi:MAG: beta-N-acetylhexosaminidase [Firmicutes bacterium]|nr:beta-N-acetylhexosaminidase [Bacillota bacterium]
MAEVTQVSEEDVRRLVGEVVLAGFSDGKTPSHERHLIEDLKIRNILLFSRNIQTVDQVQHLTGRLRRLAEAEGFQDELLIAADQENGIVRRLPTELPAFPGCMAQAACGDLELIRDVWTLTGEQMRHCGLNLNLAPVLDVNTNPLNPVIGSRSFGEQPAAVADLAEVAIRSLQASGVLACAKHFPGHGDTTEDSHLSLPEVRQSWSTIEAEALPPFARAIAAGVAAIMTAHIVFPTIDPQQTPATLSSFFLSELLRQRMGFSGVVVTDCLEMKAIATGYGIGPAAIQSLLAGADMLTVSHTLDRQVEVVNALVQAVLTGTISIQRLEQSAARVRALRRVAKASWRLPAPTPELIIASTRVQERVAAQAVTWVCNEANALPLPSADIRTVYLARPPRHSHNSAADGEARDPFEEAVRARLPQAHVHLVGPSSETNVPLTRSQDCVLLCVDGLDADYLMWVNAMARRHQDAVVVAIQSPYDLTHVPDAKTCVAVYERTAVMARAGVLSIFGEGHATGHLPVTLREAT